MAHCFALKQSHICVLTYTYTHTKKKIGFGSAISDILFGAKGVTYSSRRKKSEDDVV